MNLNNILIGSENPQGLAVYYTALFGTPGWEEGPFIGWRVGTGGLMVGPHDQVKGQNAEPGRLIWNIESPDVRGDFARLKAAGAVVVREPYSPAEAAGEASEVLIATFSDPDGNYFQLVSPM